MANKLVSYIFSRNEKKRKNFGFSQNKRKVMDSHITSKWQVTDSHVIKRKEKLWILTEQITRDRLWLIT